MFRFSIMGVCQNDGAKKSPSCSFFMRDLGVEFAWNCLLNKCRNVGKTSTAEHTNGRHKDKNIEPWVPTGPDFGVEQTLDGSDQHLDLPVQHRYYNSRLKKLCPHRSRPHGRPGALRRSTRSIYFASSSAPGRGSAICGAQHLCWVVLSKACSFSSRAWRSN